MNDVYKFNCYWTEKMKIEFLQRVILIHSYLYYEKDSPVWSDKKYDDVAKQLVELQGEHDRKSIKYNTQYGYALYDFDGTTGFDLWERLNRKDKIYISNIAERMRYESKREKENGTKWKQEILTRI